MDVEILYLTIIDHLVNGCIKNNRAGNSLLMGNVEMRPTFCIFLSYILEFHEYRFEVFGSDTRYTVIERFI